MLMGPNKAAADASVAAPNRAGTARKGAKMPRIIVTTANVGDHTLLPNIVMDEQVLGAHLEDEQSSYQLIERIGWAIDDAEKREAAVAS
jgi:hypothetical protein